MCVLEMIAREEPYLECKGSLSEIETLVNAKVHPLALKRIGNRTAREFISLCLLPADERLTAAELLNHSFLEIVGADDDEVKLGMISINC